MAYYIDQNGNLYSGDMQPGDREATQEEVDAWLDPPDTRLNRFETAVEQYLENFARTPYSDTEFAFGSMAEAQEASLTTDYKQWGDYANQAYDLTWKAAEGLVSQVMDGTLTIDEAVAQLPALAWPAADTATTN